MAWSTPSSWDSDAIEDEEPHSYQSVTKLMEVVGEEVDNQQAVRGDEAHILALEIDDSVECATHDSIERVGAASNPIANREHAREHIIDKRKEKINEKMKELVFIGGVPLFDLDNYNVTDNKLLCNSCDSNGDISPNPDGVGVYDGLGSCLQTMDSNIESESRLVAPEVGEHSEPHTTPTTSIDDPFFNAAGKAPHLDVVSVKQEADWFQLQAEKRQRKTTEKLVVQQEKERLAKKLRTQGIRLRY